MAERRSGVARHRHMVISPQRIVTNNALLWGLAWLIIGSILCWYFRMVPTSSLSYDISGYVPLHQSLLLNVAVWIISTAPFWLVAVLLNRGVAMLELFGRMLYAHWPVTLLLLPTVCGWRMEYAVLVNDVSAALDSSVSVTAIMLLLYAIVAVWYLYWSYIAFRHVVQRRGAHLFVWYIVAMTAAIVLTAVSLKEMLW